MASRVGTIMADGTGDLVPDLILLVSGWDSAPIPVPAQWVTTHSSDGRGSTRGPNRSKTRNRRGRSQSVTSKLEHLDHTHSHKSLGIGITLGTLQY